MESVTHMDAAPAVASGPQPDLLQLLKAGKTNTQIEALLMEQYGDIYLVQPLMLEVKKLRSARALTAGLVFILIGALLLLLSFVFSILQINEDGSLGLALFGLTTLGIVIVFVGLVKIFG